MVIHVIMFTYFFHCFAILFSFQVVHCLTAEVYNITSSTPLFANETLVSSRHIYELGFFTPNGSGNQYVGIWYKNKSVSKVVWVANREKPVESADPLASLVIQSDGNLWLVDGQQNLVWSTNVTAGSNSTAVELLDNGNLVLKDKNFGTYIWQSFNEPCDTLLPGMQIGIDAKTGEKRYLISWKTDIDPSPGKFIFGITSETPPQVFGWNDSTPYFRGGQWDKTRFIGIPGRSVAYLSALSLVQDVQQETAYFSINVYNSSFLRFFFFSPEGLLKWNEWDEGLKKWATTWEVPVNLCQRYGRCGPFAVCNKLNSPICSCPKGFLPKSIEEWSKGNWEGGCVRRMELNCKKNTSTSTSVSAKRDVFWKMSQMKLPDSAEYLSNIKDEGDCQSWCLSNCSCLAYSYVNTIGCMIWVKDLMDIQQFNVPGEDLHIRLAELETGANRAPLIIVLCSALGIIILGAAMYSFAKQRVQHNENMMKQQSCCHFINLANSGDKLQEDEWQEKLKKEGASELTIFGLDRISAATDNFSMVNRLGQGGFGSVYKGKLQDGKVIAVKRLSSSSGQGLEEFKNEIILISKLQHRNLVRLLGCCIEGEEKILVYEYLSNRSLDTFLFDAKKKEELKWDICFDIIHGIARGLLYLHRDSYTRVIHRDLKVSNILLDEKMTPKISDFGLARMFEGTQKWVNTYRVVGTLGYMSPEYAMGGIFSEKSDIYSFGVLLLEIVSCKKNSPMYYQGQYLNLLSYAWELWNRGQALDFSAEALVRTYSQSQIVKCIHIGLLCVQDHALDRPDMSAVVFMLSGESDLPRPKQPTFTFQKLSESSSQQGRSLSIYEVTNSIIEGR